MDDAMLMLRFEHQKMREVLALLAMQLDELEAGEEPDIALLETALDYLVGFSDQCHHPKEELIYRKMLSRNAEVDHSLIDLEQEHAELQRLTARLGAVVDMGRVAENLQRDQLVNALRQYLDYYRHHMVMEERHLFRIAPHVLSEDDWSEIEFGMFDVAEPLSKSDVEARFQHLRDTLAEIVEKHRQLRAESAEPLLANEELDRARRLTGLAAFNDDETPRNAGARLIRSPGNGFDLLLKREKLIVDIPECSEQQAAWCAFYFLKGLEASTR